MIPRKLEKTVRERLQQFPAVALLGSRQVGKTTLARRLLTAGDTHYLDLENPADLAKLADPLGYLSRFSDKLIIIDEVQRAPEIFQLLRGLIDERVFAGKTSGQFLLLGSASIDLLQQSSETLAGRIAYLELTPLNVLETAKGTEANLWNRGGFPSSFLAQTDSESAEWRANFITTYSPARSAHPGRNITSLLDHAGARARVFAQCRSICQKSCR